MAHAIELPEQTVLIDAAPGLSFQVIDAAGTVMGRARLADGKPTAERRRARSAVFRRSEEGVA